MLTPELREELCAHLAQGAPIKTACEAVGISKATYYSWRTRGKKARDEPPPTLELTRQGLIDLLTEADVTYPARATKTELLAAFDTPPPRSVPGVPGVHRKGPRLYGRWHRWPGSRQARRAERSIERTTTTPAPPRTGPPPLRCGSGGHAAGLAR